MSSFSRSMRRCRLLGAVTVGHVQVPGTWTGPAGRGVGSFAWPSPCIRTRSRAVAGESRGGDRPARARATRPARSTSRAASGWTTTSGRAFGELARTNGIVLSVHAPIAGFMGHAERDKKQSMAVGMLDHSAGIAKAAGAELVVFHPGFLLGREREEAIDSVVEQLARAARAASRARSRRAVRGRGDGPGPRPRLGRGRVRDRAPPRLGAPGDRLRAHARDLRRRVHDRRGLRTTCSGGRPVLERGAPFHIHFSDIASRTATRRSTCPTARALCAPSRFVPPGPLPPAPRR